MKATTGEPTPYYPTLIATGILSAAMLAFELTLTRLFAVAQFYHFAFMVISLALLGSGAAGSLMSAWPRLASQSRGRYGWMAVGFTVTVLLSYAVLNLIPFDSYAIAWDVRQGLYLILTFLAAAAPFLFSGLVVGGLLAERAAGLHRVYAANLIGSAGGCLLVLPLLSLLGGEGALLVSAGMGLLAAPGFFGSAIGRRRYTAFALPLLGAFALTGLALTRPGWVQVRLSPYKGLSLALLAPGAEHTISQWNAVARVDVVESDSIHALPGLSLNTMLMQPPRQAGLTRDGDNLVPITALSPNDETAQRLAANVPQGLIHLLRPAPTVLILEPGGGWDALMLLAGGAEHITLVECNVLVIDLMQSDYGAYTHDLYTDPRVTVVHADGRAYAHHTALTFDVVDIALSDSFHPVTSGAYGLGEDYRYTVEAMGDYLDRLTPDGLLLVTRWLQNPPTETPRTLASIAAALRVRGLDPAQHIAAFRTMRTMTFVIGRVPLTADERAAVRAFVASRNYDLVWLSGISADEVNIHNRLPDAVYYKTFAALLADPEGMIEASDYDIRPPTDNRPFFFHYFRWRQTPEIIAGLGKTWQPFGGSGYFVLVALLVLVTILAAVLIIGPLAIRRVGKTSPPGPSSTGGEGEVGLRRERVPLRLRVLVYFSMLGLGFLLVEMPLAQRFILFVGEPVTALAVVLFAILLFSGLGSLTAPRWRLPVALGALVCAAMAYPFALRGIFGLALGWPLAARILISILSLAPLGLLMGVPFARGLAIIEGHAPGLIPWAWAINGSASVISAVLAVMIALSWGFSAVLWVGAGAYAVALVSVVGLHSRHTPKTSSQ